MIRKIFSAALSILLLTCLAGCATDLGAGIIRELEDNKEGIYQELGELWDSFLAFPMSGPLSNGLRAAGDIRFTMIVSIASTIGGRLVFSILFAMGLNWGVIGIAAAMCLDWVIRAVIFALRLKSGKWKEFKVI